jgi:hypothetical protein
LLTALARLLGLLARVTLLLAALLTTLVWIVLALLALFVVVLAHWSLLDEMKREQEQQAARGFVPNRSKLVMMRRALQVRGTIDKAARFAAALYVAMARLTSGCSHPDVFFSSKRPLH